MSKNIKSISFLLSVILLNILFGYFIFAWQGPTQAPPGGNVPAPVQQGGNASLNNLAILGLLSLPATGISGAGAGSNLDADLLDGLQASDILEAAGSGTAAGGTGPLLEWTQEPTTAVDYIGKVRLGPVAAGGYGGACSFRKGDDATATWSAFQECSFSINFSDAIGKRVYVVGNPHGVVVSQYRATGSLNWSSAESQCVAWGGHLATVNNATENSSLFSQFGDSWIGYNDIAVEGTWRWASGESSSYTNWGPGEPNNSGNEDCVHFRSDGKWNDAQCTTAKIGVCEIAAIGGESGAYTTKCAAWDSNCTPPSCRSGWQDGGTWQWYSGNNQRVTERLCVAGAAAIYSNILTYDISGAPIAPSGLSGRAGSLSTIQLSWTDNSNSEDGFYVYRSTSSGFIPGPGNRIATLSANTVSYLDQNLAPQPYYYKVSGYRGSDESYSNEALVSLRQRKVFVTRQTFNGNLDGVTGANTKCQAAATAAGLSGTFKAWIAAGGSGDPSTNFADKTGTFIRTGPLFVVAYNWADLTDGTLQNPIIRNEFGEDMGGGLAWTNVNTGGTIYGTNFITDHCTHWLLGESVNTGVVGLMQMTDSNWTYCPSPTCNLDNNRYKCDDRWSIAHLYCFEQ